VIYQHPLAYLIGIEGLALLHGWAGDVDREYVLARLDEVRRFVNDPGLADHPGFEVARGDTATAYGQCAATYDDPDNGLFSLDQPVVDAILDTFAAGDALDAACGTGRMTASLVDRGHRVVGVDSSPEMLEQARTKLPTVDFRLGELDALPADDASVDVVLSTLALMHVADLAPVLAEFARVLRPGGHVVIADSTHELVFRGSVVRAIGPNGEPGLTPAHRHTPGDYLRAAIPLGLQVRRCEEVGSVRQSMQIEQQPLPERIELGDWKDLPWTLLALVPAAAQWAWSTPSVIVWDFELSS